MNSEHKGTDAITWWSSRSSVTQKVCQIQSVAFTRQFCAITSEENNAGARDIQTSSFRRYLCCLKSSRSSRSDIDQMFTSCLSEKLRKQRKRWDDLSGKRVMDRCADSEVFNIHEHATTEIQSKHKQACLFIKCRGNPEKKSILLYLRFPFLVSVNTTASPWPLCQLFFRLSYSGKSMPTKAEMKVVLTLYKSIQYQRAGNSRGSVKTSWSTFHNVQNEVEERERERKEHNN